MIKNVTSLNLKKEHLLNCLLIMPRKIIIIISADNIDQPIYRSIITGFPIEIQHTNPRRDKAEDLLPLTRSVGHLHADLHLAVLLGTQARDPLG